VSQRPYVGGQAVIEGVMMRGPRSLAVAVRRPDGEIVLRDAAWQSIWERLKFLRWPFFRGSVVLIESLVNGIGALNFSAEQASMELVPANANADANADADADAGQPDPARGHAESGHESSSSTLANGSRGHDLDRARQTDEQPAMSKWALYLTVAIALGFAIALFKVIPHLLTLGLGWLTGTGLNVDSVLFHAIDGVLKVTIFLLYVWAIGLLPDIKRVFMYHGAEHMTVHCYEHGLELTVENVRQFSPRHARCGTAFLVVVILLSILVFSLAFVWLPRLAENAVLNQALLIGLKLPLLLPIMGLAYEYQRFTAKRADHAWARAIAWPGLAVQALTTKKPTDDQLEVAIASMRQALWREKVGPEAPSPAGESGLIRVTDYRQVGAA